MAFVAVYESQDLEGSLPNGEPKERVELTDAQIILLDLGHPYTTRMWSTDEVAHVQTELSQRRTALVQLIRQRVQSEAQKTEWEAWMDPIFARHCSLSTELELIDKVLPIIRRAETDENPVWYVHSSV